MYVCMDGCVNLCIHLPVDLSINYLCTYRSMLRTYNFATFYGHGSMKKYVSDWVPAM